jgi:hypothetical protein
MTWRKLFKVSPIVAAVEMLVFSSFAFVFLTAGTYKQVVFQYFTNTAKNSNTAPSPTNAVKLADGNIIIADQFNDRALIINRSKSKVFQYGMTNVVGNGPNQLDGPYTAFVIGDYTGQTPPPRDF